MVGSPLQLVIVVAIIVLLFGTKKLRSLGSDLGESIKGFKKAINDDSEKKTDAAQQVEKKDADFATKSVEDQSAAPAEKKTTEVKDKEQA